MFPRSIPSNGVLKDWCMRMGFDEKVVERVGLESRMLLINKKWILQVSGILKNF